MAWRVAQAVAMAALSLAASLPAHAWWGHKVTLKRTYRTGQTMVYETLTDTKVDVKSDPPGLEAFLPPIPTNLSASLENTVTVREVHPDGSVDVENRFNNLKLDSDVSNRLPDAEKSSADEAEKEFVTQVEGETVTVHFDRNGNVAGIDGVDKMFGELDEPLREPLRQVMNYFFSQMSGNALYPGHPIRRGEVWRLPMTGAFTTELPLKAQGESTLRYAGKTRYGRAKADEIDIKFTEGLTPAGDTLEQFGPLARLEAQGLKLDIALTGQGEGKVLVSSKDGHILQNHSTIHQTLTARLTGLATVQHAASDPITMVINAETHLQIDEKGR